MIVQCVDLGDPIPPPGTPSPISILSRGINVHGQVASFIQASYDGQARTVAACFFSEEGISLFTSPFGFTELYPPPLESINDAGSLLYGAVDSGGWIRSVVADTNTGTVTVLPDLGIPGQDIEPTLIRDSAVYAYAVYTRATPSPADAGPVEFRNGSITKLGLDGYDWIFLDYVSPDTTYQCLQGQKLKGVGQPISLLKSRSNVEAYPGLFLNAVNDAGVALGSRMISRPNLVVVSGGTVVDVDIARELGRSLAPTGQRFINNRNFVVGTYSDPWPEVNPSLVGIYARWNDRTYDLMQMSTIQAFDFDSLYANGINERNQITATGRIRGQTATRVYRIDVDVNAVPAARQTAWSTRNPGWMTPGAVGPRV